MYDGGLGRSGKAGDEAADAEAADADAGRDDSAEAATATDDVSAAEDDADEPPAEATGKHQNAAKPCHVQAGADIATAAADSNSRVG